MKPDCVASDYHGIIPEPERHLLPLLLDSVALGLHSLPDD